MTEERGKYVTARRGLFICPKCGDEFDTREEFAEHFRCFPRCAVEAITRLVLSGVTGGEIPYPSRGSAGGTQRQASGALILLAFLCAWVVAYFIIH